MDYTEGKRREVIFEPGQWVWVRLRAYRQQSIQHRSNHKLAKKFFGLFQIVRRVGLIAYELALSEESRIHPVFHVSLLKLHRGRQNQDTESEETNPHAHV